MMEQRSTTLRRRRRMRRRLRHLWHTVRRLAGSYVSPLGWLTAAAAAACAIGFAACGWHELLAMAIVLAAMLLAAIVMSLGNTGFGAVIDASRKRVTVGDTVTVTVDVDNPGSTPTATARGDLAIGEMHERFRIPMLAPKQSKRTVIEFTAVGRAALRVGPLRIRKGDPFGLIRHEKELAGEFTVFIHPATVNLNTLNAGLARDLEGQPSGQVVDDDLDFHGLRAYVPGDDVRNVHWLSTAKAGTLMIRQYEATRRTDTSMTLDVNPDDYVDAQEFEMAVAVHASIGVQCLMQNRPLASHASQSHTFPNSPVGFLDWCSTIEPVMDDNPNLADPTLRHSPDASFYYFTVGSLKDLDQIRRMALALPESATCVVLRTDPGAERDVRRYPGFALATIGELNDLPMVMEVLA